MNFIMKGFYVKLREFINEKIWIKTFWGEIL